MRIPDTFLIGTLIGSEIWRRFSRRLRSGPLYRWRFSGSAPSKFTIAPRDLRPADPKKAIEFYSGHFSFGDEFVSTGGESPFSTEAPSMEWFDRLHNFRWLRHLRAVDTALAQANASALTLDWIDMWGNRLDSPAWRSDVVASRLIAWLSHSPLLINKASPSDYRRLLKSCGRQTRYLQHNAPYMRDGYPRLQAMIALAYASLCLEGREKNIRQSIKDLDRELQRQILPDGGHISRNPSTLLHLLADMLPLMQAYKSRGHSPSHLLLSSIDKMMGALRFLRHSNGDLGQFNGTGFTDAALLATIMRYDTAKGATLSEAPHSNYLRLHADKTTVLMDAGRPISRATARRALAGTLSFELSSNTTRFIANCGVPDVDFKKYAPFTRATAAHSTATINDTSSSRFASDSKLHDLLPSPLIRAPEKVTSRREEDAEFLKVVGSHNGYEYEFSTTHERELQLSHDGTTLNGSDRFIQTGKNKASARQVAIRFHLPPTISASMLSSGHSILIAGPNNDAWTFTCVDLPIQLEESIQFSGPGHPRKSEQIVVTMPLLEGKKEQAVRWVFEHRAKKPTERKTRKKASKASDTPDLLDALNDDPDKSG